MFETDLITGGAEAIESIAAEWRVLCDENAETDPFSRPEWYRALLFNFGLPTLLITIRKDGQLRAVLPLVKASSRLHGLPVRALQGLFNLNSPRLELAHSGDEGERQFVIDAIWNEISRMSRWNMLELRLVNDGSWLMDLFERARESGYRSGVWPMDAAPYIKIREDSGESFHQIYESGRKHFFKELDRRLRRLKELGDVEMKITTAFSPDMMTRYLELENLGWKGRGGTAAALDDATARLHNDFARDIADTGRLHVYELTLDGKTISMSINILAGRRMYKWKTSYDEEYSRYSPGNILFRRLLEECAKNGISEIDFLSPSTPNKRVWATGERAHGAIYIFSPGLVGSLAWAWKFAVISRIRGLKQRLTQIDKKHTLKAKAQLGAPLGPVKI
jgi:CelD/BcsL family acetyltransferase involved in cellulose biosynthesis